MQFRRRVLTIVAVTFAAWRSYPFDGGCRAEGGVRKDDAHRTGAWQRLERKK